MKRPRILIVCLCLLLGLSSWFVVYALVLSEETREAKRVQEAIRAQVQMIVDAERPTEEEENPFDANGKTRVLLIGLDTRAGQVTAHCDAIQMIEIDTVAQTVNITAVPRGTYASLPGTGHLPSEYYVSNACGIGGLSYGITQIEKILGVKHDHLVFVGFSQAVGLVRQLGLPATETLQWLRLRQSYAVGEPQRAHNHSTFLKQLLVRFTPTSVGALDIAWEYPLYKMVDTDLSFAQARTLARALIGMDLTAHPERISLTMRPAYAVTDILYDPEHLDEYINAMLAPVAYYIPEGAYTGVTKEETQQRVMDLVNAELENSGFITQAYDQQLWLQIEDAEARESVHYAIVSRFVAGIEDPEAQQALLADYILEMEYTHQDTWAQAGRELLAQSQAHEAVY